MDFYPDAVFGVPSGPFNQIDPDPWLEFFIGQRRGFRQESSSPTAPVDHEQVVPLVYPLPQWPVQPQPLLHPTNNIQFSQAATLATNFHPIGPEGTVGLPQPTSLGWPPPTPELDVSLVGRGHAARSLDGSTSIPTPPSSPNKRIISSSHPVSQSVPFLCIQESPAKQPRDRKRKLPASAPNTRDYTGGDTLPISHNHIKWDSDGNIQGSCLTLGSRQQSRGAFTEKLRLETASTRKIGACAHCRMQKIRCQAGTGGLNICQNCIKASTSARSMPCCRDKITESIIFRNSASNGHPLKFEWTRPGIKSLLRGNLAPKTRQVELELTQDVGSCLSITVSPFKPRKGDKTGYKWDDKGGTKAMDMPLYELSDQKEAVVSIKRYIKDHCWYYLQSIDKNCEILQSTFGLAVQYAIQGQMPLVKEALNLWAGCRMIERSWRICGNETLGQQTIQDEHNPWRGIIPITPIMDHQLDRIITHVYLTPLREHVLRGLEKLVYANKKENWFQIYLVTFILLHNTEQALAHSRRTARRFGINRRYFSSSRSESYFQAAKTFLMHFHMVSKGKFITSTASSPQKCLSGTLTEPEKAYLQKTAEIASKREMELRQLRSDHKYEANLFWCHQMFFGDWQPGEKHVVEETNSSA